VLFSTTGAFTVQSVRGDGDSLAQFSSAVALLDTNPMSIILVCNYSTNTGTLYRNGINIASGSIGTGTGSLANTDAAAGFGFGGETVNGYPSGDITLEYGCVAAALDAPAVTSLHNDVLRKYQEFGF
jgi:hypothetical protein